MIPYFALSFLNFCKGPRLATKTYFFFVITDANWRILMKYDLWYSYALKFYYVSSFLRISARIVNSFKEPRGWFSKTATRLIALSLVL